MPTITIPDQQLESFYKDNPDFDILDFDLNKQSSLAELIWDGVATKGMNS